MNDTLYRAARLLGSPFAYRCAGLVHIGKGPAIYVANHLGPVGPIQVMLALPVRLYPWILAETIDPRLAGQRIYRDLVRPVWGLHGRLGRALGEIIAWPGVRFLWGLGCIAIDREHEQYMAAFRRSLALLRQGKSLLIFPEDERRPLDPATGMRPFLCGFLLLCSLYERETGAPLPIYPVAVSSERREVSIGKAIFLEPASRRDGILRTGDRLYEDIARLWAGL